MNMSHEAEGSLAVLVVLGMSSVRDPKTHFLGLDFHCDFESWISKSVFSGMGFSLQYPRKLL